MPVICQRLSITASIMLLAATMPACASGKGRAKSFDNVEALIAKLVKKPPDTRVKVEKALRVSLKDNDGSMAFAFYVGSFTAKDGLIITIDFREPISSIATAGPLLVLNVKGLCYNRQIAEKRFGPIKLASIPNGHTKDGDFSYARQMPWGKLSFGYKESKPDCLKSMVFNRNKV